jgi:lantibiotic modifying enzyme
LLGAIDCHCDNLIAAGDQPVLIDAETLLHRRFRSPAYRGPAELLRTGLLPLPDVNEVHDYKVSGLGGATLGPHTPTLRGEILSLSAYRNEVAKGFQRMWNLMGKSDTMIRTAIQRLRKLRWRRVYCPTSRYKEICNASLKPSALRSGIARWQTIEAELRRNNTPKSIARREIKAIVRLDVPHFSDRLPGNPRVTASDSLSTLLSWIHSARF